MSEMPTWDAALYAANTAHHRAFDAWFLDSTPLTPSLRLVDLGCGAGDFTRVLADRVPDGVVVGVDPHPEFIAEAATRAAANQRFAVGTAQRLVDSLGGETFDGVVSRAALQWAPASDQMRIAEQIKDSLVPGGFFRLDMSGAGNIARVVRLLDAVSARFGGPTSPWCFADPGWYMEILERAGFDLDGGWVRTVVQRRPFTPETLWGWLESQVFTAYEKDLPAHDHAGFRNEVRSELDQLRRHDGTFDQTFVRLDVLARRPA
ncbi:MAG: methyltransferase domain-containing protein [Acidimicrobiia bacterium]|nr:methyltransferase domain-containing protein [Acidimicrobiia bacterium]